LSFAVTQKVFTFTAFALILLIVNAVSVRRFLKMSKRQVVTIKSSIVS